MLYSRALMNQSEFEKAEEILKKVSIRRKYDPQVWYWLAEVQGLSKNIVGLHQSRSEYFYLKGSYDQAIEHLRYALDLEHISSVLLLDHSCLLSKNTQI